ncbi:MAG: hypothetical protein M3124_08380 [Actinomycetota bacterium]|nr:hypothetical protein [Actinomycetota bacterium]
MARTEHVANPQDANVSWLSPRRIALRVLGILAVILSPILVVYEFVLGLALVAGGILARHIHRSPTDRSLSAVGVALLAGPAAYTLAWLLAQLFNW